MNENSAHARDHSALHETDRLHNTALMHASRAMEQMLTLINRLQIVVFFLVLAVAALGIYVAVEV